MVETRCVNCGAPIHLTNYAMGPEWEHYEPAAACPNVIYELAAALRAEHDEAVAALGKAQEQLADRDDWIRLTITHLAVLRRIDGGCGRTVVEALTDGALHPARTPPLTTQGGRGQ